MSRKTPDRGDVIMLRHRCGKCLVDEEMWCRTARGGYAALLHASRFYQAQAAGQFPLTDSDDEVPGPGPATDAKRGFDE